MASTFIKAIKTDLDRSNFFTFEAERIPTIDSEYKADFSAFDQVAGEIIDLDLREDPAADGTGFDQKIAPIVHSTFRHLPRCFLAKPQFWQWLALVKYRELAEIRAGVASEINHQYFLSGLTLGRQMRHVFQKPFLIADAVETVFDGSAAYADTIKIMGSAQNVQSIGEGKISYSKQFLRSKLPEIHQLNKDKERKNFIKKLNAEAENVFQEYTAISF